MEGQRPLDQNEAPPPRGAGVGRGAPLPPSPPHWPPYFPPSQPARPWLPIAIIAAAIVVAGALVSAAIIMNRGTTTATPASSTTSAAIPEGHGAPSVATSSTCTTWRTTTKPALEAIPMLPDGWDWDTPNIDTYIANRTAAMTRVLDLFEPKIADTPTDVAAAARDYISTKRTEIRLLTEHTYTAVDQAEVNVANGHLNQICGV